MAACSNIEYFLVSPEDVGSLFFRNVGNHAPDYVTVSEDHGLKGLSVEYRTNTRTQALDSPQLIARYLLPVSFPVPHHDPHAVDLHSEPKTSCFRF